MTKDESVTGSRNLPPSVPLDRIERVADQILSSSQEERESLAALVGKMKSGHGVHSPPRARGGGLAMTYLSVGGELLVLVRSTICSLANY